MVLRFQLVASVVRIVLAGGGGKGIRMVQEEKDLESSLSPAQRMAL